MKTLLAVDSAGRIVLPKPVRRHFHLERGALLEMSLQAGTITLTPQDHVPALAEEDGLLVHRGAPEGDLAAAVDRDRRNRDATLAGLGR